MTNRSHRVTWSLSSSFSGNLLRSFSPDAQDSTSWTQSRTFSKNFDDGQGISRSWGNKRRYIRVATFEDKWVLGVFYSDPHSCI